MDDAAFCLFQVGQRCLGAVEAAIDVGFHNGVSLRQGGAFKSFLVAWNRAASAILPDYGALPPEQRNMLRHVFLNPLSRAAQYDWESVARSVVAAFRADAARAGAMAEVSALVSELSLLSPEFKAMWRDNEVSTFGEAVKHIRHPVLGPISFEVSTFAVDGRADLTMLIYSPATPADADKFRSSINAIPARVQT